MDPAKWEAFAQARREELRKILGIVDPREPGLLEEVEIAGARPAEHGNWTAHHVRWPVFPGVYGGGRFVPAVDSTAGPRDRHSRCR
ncbi:MAG: hypothetical protein WDN28_29080 [Chthoniobacter sp.]